MYSSKESIDIQLKPKNIAQRSILAYNNERKTKEMQDAISHMNGCTIPLKLD